MGLSETVSLLRKNTTLAEVLESLEAHSKSSEAALPRSSKVVSLCEERRRRRQERR